MYEIARIGGVCQSRFSRILNGKTPVAPEKQAAVLEVIERLNYRPNIVAQGLVSGRTMTIGVLTRHLGSPYFGTILRGIAIGLQGSDYHPLIGLGSDSVREDEEAVKVLMARQTDGLILQVSKHVKDEYLCEIAEERPLIVIGRQVSGLEKQCVGVENFKGAYTATSYLIEKGHQSIAHISGQLAVADAVNRRDGYCQALIDHGLEVVPELIVEGDFSEAAGLLGAEKLLSRRKKYPFSAIFAANDEMAMT